MPEASVLEAAVSILKWMPGTSSLMLHQSGIREGGIGTQLLSPFYLAGDLSSWDGVIHT